MSAMPNITLLGTGLMGGPMAANLLKAGFHVTVWNRSTDKTAALGKAGATVAPSLAQAVTGADIIISMLADGQVVGSVLDDALPTLTPKSLWIDMSSTKPSEARDQKSKLATINARHLDAPVSGGTKGAEAGTLAIMVGGDSQDFDMAVPVFEAMGRPVHVGLSGSGQLAKLANQAIVAVTIGAVAEAMLLLQKGGADPASVRQALRGGFADSTILQQHGERMTTDNFAPGGLSKFQLKDLDNVMHEAASLGLTLPITTHIRDRFDRFVNDLGGADQDHSGLYLELLDQNKSG